MKSIYLFSFSVLLSLTVQSQTTWKMVSAGNLFSMAIKNDGTLWGWGNRPGSMIFGDVPIQIGQDNSWAALSCGSEHVLLLKTDSTLWAMGQNQFGQLGLGHQMPVGYPSLPVQVGNLANWTQINSGCYHSGAIQSDGTLWTWGYNGNGQLGIGGFQSVNMPNQVVGVGECKSISLNSSHSLGLFDTGNGAKLFAWGDNTYGQLGDSTIFQSTQPIQIFESTSSNFNWTVVAAGLLSSAAIRSDSTLWVFGSNGSGQLGSNVVGDQFVPVEMEAGAKWIDVKIGDLFCYGIKENSDVYCWGSNYFGVLGTGNTLVQNSPVLLSNLHIDINSFSLSKSHSFGFSFNGAHVLALDSNHKTICAVGSNNFEQLGNGTSTSTSQFSCGIADLSSLEEIEMIELTILPNPSHGIFEVHAPIETGQQFVVQTLNGQFIYKKTIDQPMFVSTLNLTLPTGIYLFQLIDENGAPIVNKRLVIE